MLKSILSIVFHPTQITKEFFKEEIHIRKILLILFIIECVSLWILSLENFREMNFMVFIGGIFFSIFGTYLMGAIGAIILYIFDKCMLKRLSTYKICFKLMLPQIIMDALVGLIIAILWIMELKLSTTVTFILELLKFIWFIVLLSYYLKKLYICKIKHVILVDITYSFLFVFPKILNNLYFY